MIEVPSAALLSGHLAREADFFSIGTNDLTQYTLAMDRGTEAGVPGRRLDPAILLMIQSTIEGARAHARPVESAAARPMICGRSPADRAGRRGAERQSPACPRSRPR